MALLKGKYAELAAGVSNNIETYTKGAWKVFLDMAMDDIYGYSDYVTLGEKNVTLLKTNMDVIKKNNAIIKNNDTHNESGRAKFTYYSENGELSTIRDEKPKLVDPHKRVELHDKKNDKYKPLKSNETPHTRSNGTTYVIGELNQGENYEKVDNNLGSYKTISSSTKNLDLLSKTANWFNETNEDWVHRRFKTLHSKFCTEKPDEITGVGDSALSKYGESHGRNLLKRDHGDSFSDEGYIDPYCRVWTNHKQYSRIKDMIRPFQDDGKNATMKTFSKEGWDQFRSEGGDGWDKGGDRLAKYGSMYDNGKNFNGFVNITPVWESGNYSSDKNTSVQKCMFSIENLAWKDMFVNYDDKMERYGLSREQKGPLGGRIMWFPPYGLEFNESTQADWQTNTFIGRGEPIYTYSNTSRSGSLSFQMLIDHPSIVDYWNRSNESDANAKYDADDVKSDEQTLLRFFAGCEILKAGNSRIDAIQETNKPNSKPKPEPPTNPNEELLFQFLVYFPNNYSGMDFRAKGDEKSNIEPMYYLLNGVGCHQYFLGGDINAETNELDSNVTDRYTYENETVGGYEMREMGVSVINSPTCVNSITTITVNGNSDYNLSKIIGKTAKNGNECPDGEGVTQKQKDEWHKKRYYYLADKDTWEQILIGDGATSYIDKTSYKLNSSGYLQGVEYHGYKDKDKTYSFADVFAAISNKCGKEYGAIKDCVDDGNVQKIEELLNNKITSIKCIGRASYQANNKSTKVNTERNTKLARERAISVKKWIEEAIGLDSEIVKYGTSEHTKENYIASDSSAREAKMDRFVLVEVFAETTKVEGSLPQQVDTTALPKQKVENDINIQNGIRYDNEAMFFSKIKDMAPAMYKKLSERIKYFNPVFHSMSPEGFNARLTFLNQCMRQGPTMSNSDSLNLNANNLAFGRPPVCVLRVGDFYNTKIVITNLQISYDPLVWDLNQEGIGVMPMIAKITLSFNFIGGSELGGPIERLQNALSFNYYANTSVYDNRAEQIEYKVNGNGETEKFLPYNLNSTIF